jgi:hypothetical protein
VQNINTATQAMYGVSDYVVIINSNQMKTERNKASLARLMIIISISLFH